MRQLERGAGARRSSAGRQLAAQGGIEGREDQREGLLPVALKYPDYGLGVPPTRAKPHLRPPCASSRLSWIPPGLGPLYQAPLAHYRSSTSEPVMLNFNTGQVYLNLKKICSFAEKFPRLQFPARAPRGGVLLGPFGAAKSAPRGTYTHCYHDPGQIAENEAGLAASYRSEPAAAHGGAGCLQVGKIVAHPDHPAPGVALGHYGLWLAELEGPKGAFR